MTDHAAPTALRDALTPVRDALLSEARADAEAARERARQAVAGVLEAAEAEAEQIRALAHEDAAEQARGLQVAAESHARRTAREVELAARRSAYDALVESARRETRSILDEPRVADGLMTLVRSSAGPDAEVARTEDGLVATRGTRRMEFSLTVLADAAVLDLLRDREA